MQKTFLQEGYYSDNVAFTRRHFHLCYEMIVVIEGHILLRIDQKECSLSAGELALIGAFEEHEISVLSDTYRRYILTFDPLPFERAIDDPRLVSVFKNRSESFDHRFLIPAQGETLLKNMIDEPRDGDAFSSSLTTGWIKEFLIRLYRQNKARFPSVAKTLSPEILTVQEYIDLHYSEEIKIAALSNRFHLNPCYLSHAFKALTGYSPKRYLLLTRLSRAKELLTHTNLSVSEISLRCGFPNSSNFIRAFRQELHITPNQYRKQ